MTVKPNTWHYRLASVYGAGNFYRRTNLCGYFWHFLFGVAVCAALVVGGVVALYFALMGPLFWIVLCIADWHLYRPMEDAMIGLVIWSLSAIVFAFVAYCVWRERKNEPLVSMPEPVREAYRGWKEKYCPVVEIAE